MTNKPGWQFLLFLENCSIAIRSGSFPAKAFSMPGRLAVLALLLVCVVRGAWLNYVATAHVDEGEVQIKLFFQDFSSPNYIWFSTSFFSVADLAAKMFFTIISAIIYSKRPWGVVIFHEIFRSLQARLFKNCRRFCQSSPINHGYSTMLSSKRHWKHFLGFPEYF